MSTEEQTTKSSSPAPKHGRDLTTGSIPRHLITFSLPMLAGSALQTAYGLVNAVWVGRGLGKAAMTAVTESFPAFFILIAVAFGLTMAASILASQAYGAKDWDRFKRVVDNSVILTLGVGIVCVVIGQFASPKVLRLMDTPPEVLAMATSYLRVFICAMPFMFGVFLISSLLRGTGDTKTPLAFQAMFLGISAVLDPILMFGWLGFPKMGLNGAALSTIVTNAGSVIAMLIYLHRKGHIVMPDWQHMRPDWEMTLITLKIGIPSMFQQVVFSFGMAAITKLVNAFGQDGGAAFGIAMRIDNLAFMPALTIGGAVSTLVGQNIGAKQYHRVREIFKWGLIVGCGMTAIGSLTMLAVPRILVHPFAKDPMVIQMSVDYLRIVGPAYIILAVMFVSNGVINAAGHTFITTAISLLSMWAIRIPLAAYLSRSMHSLNGIWYSMAAGFVIGTILSLAYYFSGRWKRPLKGSATAQAPVTDGLPLPEPLIE